MESESLLLNPGNVQTFEIEPDLDTPHALGNSGYQKGRISFDPAKKLMAPKGKGPKNYLEVKYRLVMLRDVFEEAIVQTKCEELDISKGFAMFSARVVLPTGAIGTGHGSETQSDFRDYIEKAETKAIGRALAAAGVGHQYSMEDFSYEEDSKKDYTGVDTGVDSAPRSDADKQLVSLYNALNKTQKAELTAAAANKLAQARHGVDFKKLSDDQVSAWLKELNPAF